MNRNRLLGLLVLAALILIPGQWGLKKMNTLEAQADAVSTSASQLAMDAANASAAAGEDFETRLQRYTAAIPEDQNVVGLIEQISAAATASGVEWTAGTPSTVPAQATSGAQYSLQVSISGPADRIAAFLDQLRTLERLVVVDTLSIQGEEAATTANLSLRFFSTGAPS